MRAWTIRLVVASSLGLGAFVNICGCSDDMNPLDPSFGTADLTNPPVPDQGGEDVPFGPLLVTAEAFDPDNALRIRFVAEALDGRNPPFDSILWDFGDGSEGMGTRTVHEYAEEGEQLVRVEGFDCIFTTLEGDAETGTRTEEVAPLLAFLIKVKRLKVTIEAEPGQGHAPLATQFTGQVGLPCGHSAAGYHWNFGDGATASGSLTVQHTFAAPNSYPITLTVVTTRDWAYEGATTVEVAQPNRPPQAQIEAVPSAGEAPLTVVFDGSASIDTDGEIVSYEWQFGESDDGNGQVVEHTYASEGDYTATLTVTDDDGAAHTDEVVVHVDAAGPIPNQLPTACLGAEPATGTAALEVTFDARCSTDTDGVISSWLWDFGDGVSTAGAEVTHTYSDPGEYTATLTVIDDDGGRDQAEVVVHVNGAPTAELVMSLDYDVAPTVVHFSAANSSDADGQITHYSWQFGDGSTEEGPDKVTVDHTYTAGGVYLARLTVTDDDAATARDTAWVALGELAVAPPSLDFGDAGSQETIQVSNTGGRDLEYNVSVDYGPGPNGWLSVAPAAGSCAAGQAVTVTIDDDRTVLPAGVHNAEIQVRAGNVTKTVGVTIAVVAVATSIDSHDFGSDSTVCQFEVWNAGAGVLSFEVATQPGWLQVAGAPGTSSGAQDTQTLTLTAGRAGLSPGVYAGDLVLRPAAGQGDLSKTIALTMAVAEPGALSVSPADGLVSSGTQGGPFSPLSKSFTLSNGGQTAFNWSVAKTQSWLTLSKSGGTLAPGGSDTVTVSINAQANGLSAGTHSDTVTFTNTTNGDGSTTRPVTLTVNAPGSLSVSPADGLVSSGTQGGPFSPSSKTFTVSNGGQTALDWSVARTQSWLTLSKSGGTLAPGGNDTVTATVNAQANGLSAGTHSDTVTFTNTTNGDGSTTRSVVLSVSSSSDCKASSVNWQNSSFAPQTGVFMAEFEATPNQANLDGVIALASGEGTTYGDFSVLVRFNQDGFIDVRNGATYAADVSLNYVAGHGYRFQVIVDVPAQRYEVRVDDAGDGSNWQTLASNYAFRTSATSVDHWGLIAATGSLEICEFAVGTAPLIADAGPHKTIAPGGSAALLGTASGGLAPYSYSWSPAAGLSNANVAQPTASPANTTSYTLTVTDAESQVAADTVTVSVVVAPLTVDAGADATVAPGGTTTLAATVSGGQPPCNYTWSPATGLSNPNVAQPTASPAATTTYTLTVADSQSASASDSVTVNVIGGDIYYVAKNDSNASDSNPGTEALPWKTLGMAAATAQAGDTVLVKAGTYYETLTPANSGSATAPIVLMVYPGDTAVISGGSGIRMVYKNHIRIQGFEVTNSTGHGVLMIGQDLTLIGNRIYGNGGDGISMGGTAHIEGNTVYGHWLNSHADGLQYGGASTTSLVIKNNVFYDNGQEIGIDPFSMPSNPEVTNIHIYGNLLYKVQEDVDRVGTKGILIASKDMPITNIRIHSNTIVNMGAGITLFGAYPIEGVTIRNNIFYNSPLTFLAGIDADFSSDHNLFCRPPGSSRQELINWSGSRYTNLLAFQVVRTTQEQNSIEGDPQFKDPGRFNYELLLESPAVDAGDRSLAQLFNMSVPFPDVNGRIRPTDVPNVGHDGTGAYDIGACERELEP
ncbi:MAG TPA: PKD domain-containing protein [Phycisphaerae bacterium]|nr:PKD domain-containing protein [Phycisphaerae bacterium]